MAKKKNDVTPGLIPDIASDWTVPDLDLQMKWINPGTFKMGNIEAEKAVDFNENKDYDYYFTDESPITKVKLEHGFWIGIYPVTQEQYTKIFKFNPSKFQLVGKNHPVESLSWVHATRFCKVLNNIEKKRNRLPDGYEYRLPTEAEWEYCCRAGTETLFSFGNSLTKQQGKFWSRNSATVTMPVGKYSANEFGLYDMHGNVSEWCFDWYSPYRGGTISDPKGVPFGKFKVYRGGNGFSLKTHGRSAARNQPRPGAFFYNTLIGFRLVLGKKNRYSVITMLKITDIIKRERFRLKAFYDISDSSFKLRRTEKNGKWGFINCYGSVVIDLIYDDADDFSPFQGLAPVKKNGKWGFIDTTGDEIIGFKYNGAKNFEHGLAEVKINDCCWFINKNGVEYFSAKPLKDGMRKVKRIRKDLQRNVDYVTGLLKTGFVNISGEEVIPCEYDSFSGNLDDGYIWGEKDEISILISKKGVEYDGRQVTRYSYTQYNLTHVIKNKKHGFLYKDGNELIPAIYDDAGNFSEGFVKLKLGEKWGFADPCGDVVVNFKYDDAGDFFFGRVNVKQNDKWGAIDEKDNLRISFLFDEMKLELDKITDIDGYYSERLLILVTVGERKFYIDEDGVYIKEY